jgi:hypothetical protein
VVTWFSLFFVPLVLCIRMHLYAVLSELLENDDSVSTGTIVISIMSVMSVMSSKQNVLGDSDACFV